MWTLRAPWPLRAGPARPPGRGPPAVPKDGGHRRTSLVTGPERPPARPPAASPSPGAPRQPPFVFLVTEPAPSAQVPGTPSAQVPGTPSPAHTPSMTPPKLLRRLSVQPPSPAATSSPHHRTLLWTVTRKAHKPLLHGSRGPAASPGYGLPRAGGRPQARPRLHPASRRAAAAGAPTQAAEGRRAKAPGCATLGTRARRPRPAACALRGPLCVHLPRG